MTRKQSTEMQLEYAKALEHKNITLSELLGQIEREKRQIEDNVMANIENLIFPIIQKLRLQGHSPKYLQLLQNNLKMLTSSFGRVLAKNEVKLSPREIEICNMIKYGLTSKEIAILLNTTLRTTEKHRAHIRNKLGIINKDINLTSFLKSFY